VLRNESHTSGRVTPCLCTWSLHNSKLPMGEEERSGEDESVFLLPHLLCVGFHLKGYVFVEYFDIN